MKKIKENVESLKKQIKSARYISNRGLKLSQRLALTLASILALENPAMAMVSQMSPAETSIPEFWMAEKVVTTPDQAWETMRNRVLGDESNRISSDFKIPESLRKRTEFWFDIYTRYGSDDHVIHHVLYPWIVFKVIHADEMVKTGKGPLWLRKDRAQKFVIQQMDTIRRTLRKLARQKNFGHLNDLEKELVDDLVSVPGSRHKVYLQASQFVREQLGQRDFFRSGLTNSSRYLPYMEAKFQDAGLPVELTRLPFVESSFNEAAFSKVGASGVWQIMPRTGKGYKLIVTSSIDERNSPIKATATAARMLNQLHHATKSWPLSITAWNHGIGNIQTAIRRARSKDLATIISRYHSGDFKFASSNFYTCFLAALHAEKYNELIFNDLAREPLQQHKIVILSHRTSIKHIEQLTGMTEDQLLEFNLDLKSSLNHPSFVLPKGFELHLPTDASVEQVQVLGSIQVSKFRQTSI